MSAFNLELDKKDYTFPKGFSPKVNVIEYLEFDFAYYDITVEDINHNTTAW